jgi:hypothetical protein
VGELRKQESGMKRVRERVDRWRERVRRRSWVVRIRARGWWVDVRMWWGNVRRWWRDKIVGKWNWPMLGAIIFFEIVAIVMVRIGGELLLNLGSELLGIIITVVVIDWIYHGQEEKALKERLIRQLKSRDNADACQAANELQAHGWLGDKRLSGEVYRETDLSYADLRGANFERSLLVDVIFDNSNLMGARFNKAVLVGKITFDQANLSGATFEQCRLLGRSLDFSKARELRKTTLPGGKYYDGRYRLPHDFLTYGEERVSNPSMSWAEFYGVTEEEYAEGQKWYEENMGKEGV